MTSEINSRISSCERLNNIATWGIVLGGTVTVIASFMLGVHWNDLGKYSSAFIAVDAVSLAAFAGGVLTRYFTNKEIAKLRHSLEPAPKPEPTGTVATSGETGTIAKPEPTGTIATLPPAPVVNEGFKKYLTEIKIDLSAPYVTIVNPTTIKIGEATLTYEGTRYETPIINIEYKNSVGDWLRCDLRPENAISDALGVERLQRYIAGLTPPPQLNPTAKKCFQLLNINTDEPAVEIVDQNTIKMNWLTIKYNPVSNSIEYTITDGIGSSIYSISPKDLRALEGDSNAPPSQAILKLRAELPYYCLLVKPPPPPPQPVRMENVISSMIAGRLFGM